METKTGLTPQQKQRILTPLGWTVTRAFGYYWLNDKDDDSHGDGDGPASFSTELAAWNSWEPDANWCETELKPLVEKFSADDVIAFSAILIRLNNRYYRSEFWVALTPELLCTVFLKFLEEERGE
jgi:hypothetical protein